METQLLDSDQILTASEIIKNGGIVGIPTETVYGLAADAFNVEAVLKIFEAKGRPPDNPLIVHIASMKDLKLIVKEFPENAQKLAKTFWPGPLTLILPKQKSIPDCVSAGLGSVAVRFPSHNLARKIITLVKAPLVAPSANKSGSPSPTSAQHVSSDLGGRIDAVLDGGACALGIESTVIDLTEKIPKVLRPGIISPSELQKCIGEIEIYNFIYDKMVVEEKPKSPGMKYTHYSPRANVVIVKGPQEKYINFVNLNSKKNSIALCFEEDIAFLKIPYISYGKLSDTKTQAKRLFSSLRKADDIGAETVYARHHFVDDISIAIYNRLIRAAGFQTIDL